MKMFLINQADTLKVATAIRSMWAVESMFDSASKIGVKPIGLSVGLIATDSTVESHLRDALRANHLSFTEEEFQGDLTGLT